MFTMFEKGHEPPILPLVKTSAEPEPSQPERLYRDLQAHRDGHAAMLGEAGRAATAARTPLAGYLLRLIEENETRQLDVLDRMATSLRDALYWTYSPDGLPDGSSSAERDEAIKSMKELLRLEQSRCRGARRLAKAYSGINGGLEQALLEASAVTSENNARLLRLMLRRFKAAPQSGSFGSRRRQVAVAATRAAQTDGKESSGLAA